MKQEWELAKADLDQIMLLEPQNGEAKGMLKTIT